MEGSAGRIIGGCRIIRRLGSGGMGDVYLAEQVRLKRQVAIKIVQMASDVTMNGTDPAERFALEAQAIAAMEHPHILPVYDFGEQDGLAYLVMAYAPNGSLQEVLTPGHPAFRFRLPLSLELAGTILDQAAQALQHAHDRGVLHRDVKPANFLLRQSAGGDIHLLLADFGLAKFAANAANSGVYSGTVVYSAPEQIQQQATAASDQYSLAVMIYLLLTGQPPFRGGLAEVMMQHLQFAPPSLRTLNPAVPAEVDIVVLRALAKNPAERWPSVTAFAVVYRQAMAAAKQASSAPFLASPAAAASASVPAQPVVPFTSPAQPAVPLQNQPPPVPAPVSPARLPVSPPTQIARTTPALSFPGPAQPVTVAQAPPAGGAFIGAGPLLPPPVLPSPEAPRRSRRWLGLAGLGAVVALVLLAIIVLNLPGGHPVTSTGPGAGTTASGETPGGSGTPPTGTSGPHVLNLQTGVDVDNVITSCEVKISQPSATFHEQSKDLLYVVFTARAAQAGVVVALYNTNRQKVRDDTSGPALLDNCPGQGNYGVIIDVSGVTQPPPVPVGRYFVGASYATDPNKIPPPEVLVPVTIVP